MVALQAQSVQDAYWSARWNPLGRVFAIRSNGPTVDARGKPDRPARDTSGNGSEAH